MYRSRQQTRGPTTGFQQKGNSQQKSVGYSSNPYAALSDDWKAPKASNKEKPSPKSFPKPSLNPSPNPSLNPSSNPSPKNVSNNDIFENYDSQKNKIMSSGSTILNSVFCDHTDDEFGEALEYVCKKYSWKSDDWEAISEATNLICDKRILSRNCQPICSVILGEPVVTNFSENSINDSQPLEDCILPQSIALICEWQLDSKEWTSEIVAIMATYKDFWNVIDEIGNNEACTHSKFALPLLGKETNANEIFSKLISAGKKYMDNEDMVNIAANNVRNVNGIVSQYNSLHPVWSFVKVPMHATKETKIDVPFIRVSGRAINAIDINLKDTRANCNLGINIIDPDFNDGYIPRIIMDFITGSLPQDICSVAFNKTIAVNGSTYFKGYRLRVLTQRAEQSVLGSCKIFLENQFIKNISEKNDYSKCVVRISIPK